MATARELETYLFAEFPAQDACDWDNPGISVGFPEREITGIALALDADAQAIAAADILCGAKRMLAGYEEKTCYPCYLAKDVLPVLLRERPARAAVLFSGASGFFSGAKKMRTGLAAGLEEAGLTVDIKAPAPHAPSIAEALSNYLEANKEKE